MKYLNLEGVRYLWSKIKEKIDALKDEIEQLKETGLSEGVPLFGTLFLPHDKEVPSGYEKTEEYYIPIEYIGIDENTTLAEKLEELESKINKAILFTSQTDEYVEVEIPDSAVNSIYNETGKEDVDG